MVRHVHIYVYDKIIMSLILLDVDLPPVAQVVRNMAFP